MLFDNLKNMESRKKWIQNSVKECKSSYPLPEELYNGKKAKIAVDIGANVGGFCIPNAEYFENIYAFEPFHYNCKVIEEVINSNPLFKKTIRLYQNAVYSESGKILDLMAPNLNCSGDITCIKDGDKSKKIGFKCSTISLNDIFNILPTDKIDYLKVDCEGSEYEIFENFNDYDKIDVICLEIHGNTGLERKKDLVKEISKHYRIFFPGHTDAPETPESDKTHGWVELNMLWTLDYNKLDNILCIHKINSNPALFPKEMFLEF